MPLPKDLLPIHIERAANYVEDRAADLIELYFEQANIFSAVISILGAKGLDALSPYKKHKHPDVAQQRFPDLSLHGHLNPPPEEALESKGSTRAWAIQSHYDHPSWYVVWRYLIDQSKMIKPSKPVVLWRVDVVYLAKEDWRYEGSTAGAGGGGRTYTFGVVRPAEKLKGAAAYSLPGIALKGGRPYLAGIPLATIATPQGGTAE